MYYIYENNNKLIGCGECLITNEDIQNIPIEKTTYNDYKENPLKYIYENGKVILNPNYEEEKQAQERERLNALTLTGADVERAIYEAKGMDFDDLVEYVINTGITGFDVKRLKIELKANNFYRGHEYINMIGQMLGYTPNDMDVLFETKHLPVKEEKEVASTENNIQDVTD